MRKLLALALALLMLGALVPAAAAADEPYPMKQMAEKPTFDGVITPAGVGRAGLRAGVYR